MTEADVRQAAAHLLREAVDGGRLPEAPSPESLARIAAIIRPSLARNKKEGLECDPTRIAS
jgi:hypothetical protein